MNKAPNLFASAQTLDDLEFAACELLLELPATLDDDAQARISDDYAAMRELLAA